MRNSSLHRSKQSPARTRIVHTNEHTLTTPGALRQTSSRTSATRANQPLQHVRKKKPYKITQSHARKLNKSKLYPAKQETLCPVTILGCEWLLFICEDGVDRLKSPSESSPFFLSGKFCVPLAPSSTGPLPNVLTSLASGVAFAVGTLLHWKN